MIERTYDLRRVKCITAANEVEGNEWVLNISRNVIYLIEVKSGQDVGVWCFEPEGNDYSMHTAMSKSCRGKAAVESALDAIRWVYANTDVNNIIAPVAVQLKHVQRIPIAAGLVYDCTEYGRKIYRMNRELFRHLSEAM